MRTSWIKLFLIAACICLFSKGYGQTAECTGSFGDPVINQDFGSGASLIGPQLGSESTTMIYTSNNCPDDKYYTIAHSIVGAANCHSGVWHDVPADHTGNPNGYMMIVNASEDPGTFFTQKATGLCPNTTYQFSAYILNLIMLSASGPDVHEPDITFSVETADGHVLATGQSGPIAPRNDVYWNFYGINFHLPDGVTDVVVRMVNNAPGGNGNDLILDDITFRACGPIIQTGVGSADGLPVQGICEGTNTDVTLKAKVIGNNPVTQWQSTTNGVDWVDIQGASTDTYVKHFTNAVAGKYQYRLGVANGSDIASVDCRVYSSVLTVTVNPLPVAPTIPPQAFCEGTTLTLAAAGGYEYTWTGPNLPPTVQNPLIIQNISLADAGKYTVVPKSQAGCEGAPVDVQVTITPKVVATVSADIPVCAGVATQLTASGGLYYKWTPSTGLDHDDIPNPMAKPLVTTTYNVNVSNDACNDDSKSITVTVWNPPLANGGGDKKIFEGQSVKLNGTVSGDNITSVSWMPTTGLDDPLSPTPIATPTDDITYTMTVTSANCGIATSLPVFVRVYKKITIPNAFSPNNDGINDLWNIEALFTYPESLTQVFNRYGKRVFQSTGYSKAWDGTYNGSPLPEGTYYYIIDLKNNMPKLSGWVVIVK